MTKHLRVGLAVAVTLCLPACATVTRGTKQKFVIETTPTSADVALSTGQSCTTPCTLKVKRKPGFTARITKDGYQPVEATVTSDVSGGGGTAFAGNVILGGLVGGLVDASNGSMNSLAPNPLKVTMVPVTVAATDPAASPAAAPVPAGAPGVQTTTLESEHNH